MKSLDIMPYLLHFRNHFFDINLYYSHKSKKSIAQSEQNVFDVNIDVIIS